VPKKEKVKNMNLDPSLKEAIHEFMDVRINEYGTVIVGFVKGNPKAGIVIASRRDGIAVGDFSFCWTPGNFRPTTRLTLDSKKE